MKLSDLAQWVLRLLKFNGPQDFHGLLSLLKTDPDYGHLSIADQSFEARLRQCLSLYSRQPEQLFIQGFNYKWNLLHQTDQMTLDLPKKTRTSAWLTFGQGCELVYGIFCPKSMRESWQVQTTSYPVKIGRTNRPIVERLIELQTGNFMDLQVGVLIKTNNSKEVEKYLHNQLLHRKMDGYSSQSEWFLTSLESIIETYKQYSDHY